MKYGLIGEKLGHSYSKLIQEKLIPNHTYEIHPFPKEELDSFMKKKDFLGINVTIPYKQDVIPYLDEIDEHALKIGAVNTIVNQNGILKGYNTDYSGFEYTLEHHNVLIHDKKVMILGNGGASKAVQAVIQDMNGKEMLVVSRHKEENTISYEEALNHHLDVNIMINTTPLGMYPNNDAQAIDLSLFHNLETCLDLVYNPLHTKLLVQAKALNIKAINGLEMLVAQAKYALEYFKNIKIKDAKIHEIYQDILLETSNLVFIGMPGSGKSTIAHKCAKYLHRSCIDIDKEIIKEIQMSISDYFKKFGEDSFREIESRICKNFAAQGGLVISCGGGIVKKKENILALRQNGILIQLDREFQDLFTDHTRPLSSNKEDLMKLKEERTPLYEWARDICIENNDTVSTVSNKAIIEYKKAIKNY